MKRKKWWAQHLLLVSFSPSRSTLQTGPRIFLLLWSSAFRGACATAIGVGGGRRRPIVQMVPKRTISRFPCGSCSSVQNTQS
uniref:Putative secreted protein n=1 Tax=Ixodes ricinus TaxID=34613 RepID=A0A6B0U2N1_IXORI